jgi:3-phenylpropionate/trans-cinnamate dioxygenase ferredoxin subunit
MYLRACSFTELDDAKPFPVEVGGVEIVVVRQGDEVFAIRDECSHAAVALSEGDVDDCEIECWLHGSTFSLRTGAAMNLPATEPVPVYPVTLDGDDVLVDVTSPLPVP